MFEQMISKLACLVQAVLVLTCFSLLKSTNADKDGRHWSRHTNLPQETSCNITDGICFFSFFFFLQKAKMHVDCEPIAIGLRWLGVPFGTRLHKSVSQSSQVSVSRQVIASSA